MKRGRGEVVHVVDHDQIGWVAESVGHDRIEHPAVLQQRSDTPHRIARPWNVLEREERGHGVEARSPVGRCVVQRAALGRDEALPMGGIHLANIEQMHLQVGPLVQQRPRRRGLGTPEVEQPRARRQQQFSLQHIDLVRRAVDDVATAHLVYLILVVAVEQDAVCTGVVSVGVRQGCTTQMAAGAAGPHTRASDARLAQRGHGTVMPQSYSGAENAAIQTLQFDGESDNTQLRVDRTEVDTCRKRPLPTIAPSGGFGKVEVAELHRPARALRPVMAGGVQQQEVHQDQVARLGQRCKAWVAFEQLCFAVEHQGIGPLTAGARLGPQRKRPLAVLTPGTTAPGRVRA